MNKSNEYVSLNLPIKHLNKIKQLLNQLESNKSDNEQIETEISSSRSQADQPAPRHSEDAKIEKISLFSEDQLDPIESEDLRDDNDITSEDLIIDEDSILTDELDLDEAENENLLVNSSFPQKETIISAKIFLDRKEEGKETIPNEKIKYKLNVGGKNFEMDGLQLEKLGISLSKLFSYEEDSQIYYFLDRDPHYFTKIITLINIYPSDTDLLLKKMEEYSESFINELCYYGLIDSKYKPEPKIKLKRLVSFSNQKDQMIKLNFTNHTFKTFARTLNRSHYFNIKLKTTENDVFYLESDPKVFRYVLNFLRTGELYTNQNDILDMLRDYGIEYEQIEKRKISEQIVPVYYSQKTDIVPIQLYAQRHIYPDYQGLFKTNFTNVYQTESELSFGNDIVFHLTNEKFIYGESITDFYLSIDIPIIKPTEQYTYRDYIGYLLTEKVSIYKQNSLFLETNPNLLYLYPIIYTDKPQIYHQMSVITESKTKLLFNNELIDIHRITLPLLFFKKDQELPINSYYQSKTDLHLVVKMASHKKLFKEEAKEIPLLNVSLIANFTTKENLNTKIPRRYFYDSYTSFAVGINPGSNPNYDTVTVSLKDMGMIKDFFFTAITKEDYLQNNLDKFNDWLIDLELIYVKENKKMGQKTIENHGHFDSFMLNKYIPMKYFDRILPSGIYYYSFCTDPLSGHFSGGLPGLENYAIHIKFKKNSGFVKFFFNQCIVDII